VSRLDETLSTLGRERRKALSLFLTAGYPTAEATPSLALAFEEAGADLLEIGIPFSDPIADGSTIQRSYEQARRNGTTLRKTFGMVSEIRRRSAIPIILMGYANPVFAFGLENFIEACADAGVDGAIIPDLPLEESASYRSHARARGLSTIFLVAPTTTQERMSAIDEASTGFVYGVSLTGVTGARSALPPEAEGFLASARSAVRRNPLLVGFGIASAHDAVRMAALSDGVIIGSALLNALDTSGTEGAVAFVRSMRTALDGAR